MSKKDPLNTSGNNKDLKECFIITPIGSPDSEIFKKTEGLINSVLRPILNEHGFEPLPAHHIDSTGSINKQIIEKIVNSELVIANLTNVNPNVMYELAIRHSFGKRVITVAEHGTKLPFDIIDQRTIFYSDTMHGVDKFKPELSKAIKKCLEENEEAQNISNPIFDAVKQVAEIKSLPDADRNALQIILSKLNLIHGKQIKQSNNNNSFELNIVYEDFNEFDTKREIENLFRYWELQYEFVQDKGLTLRYHIFNISFDSMDYLTKEILRINNIIGNDYGEIGGV